MSVDCLMSKNVVLFVKEKTAYEMRISDWSSDVCSSDLIHGATMASAEFDDDSQEKRPTVQVGDPFTEKLLIEACLELMATDAIVAIQDMGAAGLTSSSLALASKGGSGADLELDKVPHREHAQTPYQTMHEKHPDSK